MGKTFPSNPVIHQSNNPFSHMAVLRRHWLIIFFALALLLALALRLPKLAQRPLHGDEAVHAIKFGALLEEGFYRYDRHEYHGPTLNYFTLIPAWLGSVGRLTEVNEWHLRLVPVFFGTLLVLMPMLLREGMGKSALAIAALLTAISPAMSYYSRYYIQEILLVCFTFGAIACAYRYLRSKHLGWALATGGCLGLMHATKETCIIAWGAMVLALVMTLAWGHKGEGSRSLGMVWGAINYKHVLAALAAALLVSVLFYSSLLSNPRGVLDSILTYKTYFDRAGNNELHVHPWYYYLKTLIYARFGKNPFWSEAIILILASAGFIFSFTKKRLAGIDLYLLRFLACYTLLMTVIYAIIPYKTPWNLLSFFHGMILLAGAGSVAIMNLLPQTSVRNVVMALMLVGGTHLVWQAYLANYEYYENPANPYVYAHPVNDVFAIVHRVEEMAQANPEGRNLYVQVICPDDDYWPLPWYLRSFTNIGWWNKVKDDAPAAPVIIASSQVEPAILRKLYELPPPGQRPLYVPLFDGYTELRPQIELRGYVRKDLWDRFQEWQAQRASGM